MTTKQLNKSIEASEKMVAKYTKNVAMYTDRMNKAIAAFNGKYNTGITVDSIIMKESFYGNHRMVDFTLAPEYLKMDWSMAYKIIDNRSGLYDNERHLESENKHLAEMRNELAAIESANAAADAAYNNSLEQSLRNAMTGFRTAWMNRMMNWSRGHFQYINDNKDSARAWRNKMQNVTNRYYRHIVNNHPALYMRLKSKNADLCKILADDAAHMTETEYMKMMEKHFADHFESCIKTMTAKCDSFGVDGNTIRIIEQDVTQRGFEMLLTDKSGMVVDARIIWCAEYSVLVTPHPRYIVTKRTK